MIEGTSQVGKLALFILVIFIELISAHKSAKREREREREKKENLANIQHLVNDAYRV